MILEYQIAPGYGLRGLLPPSAPAGRAISGIISDQHAMMPVLLELMKYSDESSRFMSALHAAVSTTGVPATTTSKGGLLAALFKPRTVSH